MCDPASTIQSYEPGLFCSLSDSLCPRLSLQPPHTRDYARRVLTSMCGHLTKIKRDKNHSLEKFSRNNMKLPWNEQTAWPNCKLTGCPLQPPPPACNDQKNPTKNRFSCLNDNNERAVSEIKGMLNYPTHLTNKLALTFLIRIFCCLWPFLQPPGRLIMGCNDANLIGPNELKFIFFNVVDGEV